QEDLRVTLHRALDRVEHLEAHLAGDLVRARRELHALQDLELIVGDLHERRPLVGTAVGVLEAVVVLRLIGTLVLVVGDAVVIAIRHVVGAAVLVLEAVVGLGLVRTLVLVVGDAVVVVVVVGAAVLVLEAVLVLGDRRAL